jgi:alkylated DNA nucleotide flippase Atl1
VRIASEAAEEDRKAGRPESQITPYWRVIRDDGSLIDKFPGGTKAQAQRLMSEGHMIKAAQGKRAPKVVLNEWSLVKLV